MSRGRTEYSVYSEYAEGQIAGKGIWDRRGKSFRTLFPLFSISGSRVRANVSGGDQIVSGVCVSVQRNRVPSRERGAFHLSARSARLAHFDTLLCPNHCTQEVYNVTRTLSVITRESSLFLFLHRLLFSRVPFRSERGLGQRGIEGHTQAEGRGPRKAETEGQ